MFICRLIINGVTKMQEQKFKTFEELKKHLQRQANCKEIMAKGEAYNKDQLYYKAYNHGQYDLLNNIINMI